jgi:hypothetical protein
MNIYAQLLLTFKASEKDINENELVLESEFYEFQERLEAFLEEGREELQRLRVSLTEPSYLVK